MIIILSALILLLSIFIFAVIIVNTIYLIKENKKVPFINYFIFFMSTLCIYMYGDFLFYVYRGAI